MSNEKTEEKTEGAAGADTTSAVVVTGLERLRVAPNGEHNAVDIGRGIYEELNLRVFASIRQSIVNAAIAHGMRELGGYPNEAMRQIQTGFLLAAADAMARDHGKIDVESDEARHLLSTLFGATLGPLSAPDAAAPEVMGRDGSETLH